MDPLFAPPVASDPSEIEEADTHPLAEILMELYERRAQTGDDGPLRRALRNMRRNLRMDAKVAAMVLEASIPNIDLDGAEWLLEELGLAAEEV